MKKGGAYCELSKRRDNMEASTGRSAMTAVVMTVLALSLALLSTRKLPPCAGFMPRIQDRC